MTERTEEKDAGRCHGSIPVDHTLGALPDHCSTCAEYDGPRRRTEAEARRCSQVGCPGDGRYQPPGRGHMPGCQHNAVAWVWETVTPPTKKDAPVRCGEHYDRHPELPHLVAVCALPAGHDGAHSNVLPKTLAGLLDSVAPPAEEPA